MAHLVVESGADKRKIFALTGKNKFICGRSSKADVVINDPFASGQHFGLLCKDGTWYIQDLNSSNGIEVNEDKVQSSKLTDNDIIHVGSTFLRFVDPQGGDEDAADEKINLPRLSGYDVLNRLGVGGMGEVYRAKQVSLDREVALKILFKRFTKDKEYVQKFFQEARAAGNLNHPNIVQVHDVGEENGIFYICMEYISGGNLTDLLRKHGALDQATTIRVSIEVAKGLAYAQSKNLVHCDIKPDNIMFAESGMAKIADLGIARHGSAPQTQQKEVLGSPHYMAPEQAMGKPVDHRADLYSLGCTMFRMLAGRTPFSGTSAREVMKKQVMEEPPDIMKFAPEISPELADVIDSLLEKEPEKRIQSANELIDMLDRIAHGKVNDKPAAANAQPRKRHAATGMVGKRGSGGNTTRTRSVAVTQPRPAVKRGNPANLVAILVAVVAVGGYLVYSLASDYKPKRALAGAKKNIAVQNYAEALKCLDGITEVRDPKLAEEIATLRQTAETKFAEEKRQEQMRIEKIRADELFRQEWKKYQQMRKGTRKTKPKKLDLVNFLNKLELTFATDAQKLRQIREEKDFVTKNLE